MVDELLLVLRMIELLCTVPVSMREHSLSAEPFLIVRPDRRRPAGAGDHRRQDRLNQAGLNPGIRDARRLA